MNTKVLIIDDEPDSVSILKILLKQFPGIDKIYSHTNSVMGFEALKTKKPDILFLDLQMPGLTGMEILGLIQTFHIHVHVIIITGYEEMVLQAAHFGMIDYLLKPIDINELKKSLEKFLLHKELHIQEQNFEKFLNYQNRKIRIPTSFEELFFAPDEIYYLEADGNYTQIYMVDGNKVTSSFHLGKIQNLLPADIFYRISRKVIINYQYLKKIDKRKKIIYLNHFGKEFPYFETRVAPFGINNGVDLLQKSHNSFYFFKP